MKFFGNVERDKAMTTTPEMIEKRLKNINFCQQKVNEGKGTILLQTALDQSKAWFANEHIVLKLEGGKYVLDTQKNNTKTCTRCNGIGRYSYNVKDGDVCYGCGGLGKVFVTPKGQTKVKPTVTGVNALHKATVGDILEINCILYKVESIKWTEYTVVGKHYLTSKDHNQKLIFTRLVDEKQCRLYRCKIGSDGYAIKPTPEMIGKEA